MAAISQLRKLVADVIGADGGVTTAVDVECTDSDHGLILHDRTDDTPFRLKVTSGTLAVEDAS